LPSVALQTTWTLTAYSLSSPPTNLKLYPSSTLSTSLDLRASKNCNDFRSYSRSWRVAVGPDLTLYQHDQRNGGHHHHGGSEPSPWQRAETLRPTTVNHDLPPPMGWSTSAPSAYPFQSGPPPQHGIPSPSPSPTRHQQSEFTYPPEDGGFSGGFVLPDTSSGNGNGNGISASPAALTPSSSVYSLPSSSARQAPPPVVRPTVDDDEYVRFPFRHFLTTNLSPSCRCFAWFIAVDQDDSGQVSHEELRTLSC
jgi:hypothetical protein